MGSFKANSVWVWGEFIFFFSNLFLIENSETAKMDSDTRFETSSSVSDVNIPEQDSASHAESNFDLVLAFELAVSVLPSAPSLRCRLLRQKRVSQAPSINEMVHRRGRR